MYLFTLPQYIHKYTQVNKVNLNYICIKCKQWIFYCHLLCLLCLGTLRSFRAIAIPVVVGFLKLRHRGTLGGSLAAP